MTPTDPTRAADRERAPGSLAEYETRVELPAPGEPDPAEQGMQVFRPFGPLIARVRVPMSVVEGINRFVDDYLAQHGDPVRPEGGPVTVGTFNLPETFLTAGGDRSLASLIARLVLEYLDRAESPHSSSVRFERFWIVRHVAGTFSPVHFHSSDVTGVLYLAVPPGVRDDSAVSRNYLTGRKAGHITYFTGGRQRYCKSFASFKPQVGDLLISPGWLLHAVEPFTAAGERRSMAFNAFVD